MALLNTFARLWLTGLRSQGGRGLLLAFVLAGCVVPRAAAQTTPSREYQIKAVFLFNFIQFVEWPPAAFPDDSTPIRIGVLGDDPFGPALEEAVRGESIRNRSLVVRRAHRLEEIQDCQLLFICKSEQRKLDNILSRLGNRPVLTVSEVTGFTRQGGIIAFYQDGKKVRFEINSTTAQKSGLKLSSQLLGLGRIVGAETAKENP